MGAEPQYFDSEALRTVSLPFTTVEDGLRVRDRVVQRVPPARHERRGQDQGFGRFGAGFSYQMPRSNWALCAQGDGFVYKVSNFGGGTALTGFDKTQVDVAYSGGLSYRLPF